MSLSWRSQRITVIKKQASKSITAGNRKQVLYAASSNTLRPKKAPSVQHQQTLSSILLPMLPNTFSTLTRDMHNAIPYSYIYFLFPFFCHHHIIFLSSAKFLFPKITTRFVRIGPITDARLMNNLVLGMTSADQVNIYFDGVELVSCSFDVKMKVEHGEVQGETSL